MRQGERHVVNTGYAYSVLRVEPWNSTLVVDDSGVHGRLTLQVADLDYDKDIVLVGTTDDWETIVEMPIGNAGDRNRWVWVEKFPWSAWERWQLDVDLPGTGVERFQYAVVYRHGVVNGPVFFASTPSGDVQTTRLPRSLSAWFASRERIANAAPGICPLRYCRLLAKSRITVLRFLLRSSG